MYIVDDICYAGELTHGIKITKVRPLQGKMMLITFSTGETRLLDATLLLRLSRQNIKAATARRFIFIIDALNHRLLNPTTKKGAHQFFG